MNKETKTNIGFIGAGNMASALVGGMISNGFEANSISLSDINEEQLEQAKQQFSVNTLSNNEELIKNADIIVLAVKPQVMQTVIESISASLVKKQPLVISIAAGITVDSICQWSKTDLPVIRCMPNTPALVKLGASALYANTKVSDEQKKLAQKIMEAVGIVEWLDEENKIDAVTALSGSGPAYYFLMMEAMIAAGVELGLSKNMASTLTIQTALGAATMAQQSDIDIAELRRRVTSPKGTTEAALNSFDENNYLGIVKQAMNCAEKRSVELAKQ
jgi:pyrroline-5-carboxylate reductase